MIAFYAEQGHFIASVQEEDRSLGVTGDVQFLAQISRGNLSWHHFKTNLMAVDGDGWQSLVLPDDSIPPSTFAAAVLMAMPQPEAELEGFKFKFKDFEGFGSVGPLLLDVVPDLFEAAVAADRRFDSDVVAKTELVVLRDYYSRLKADPARWESYLEEWHEEDLALGNHIIFNKPDSPAIILIELGWGLWVKLLKTYDNNEPENVEFHNFGWDGSDDDIAFGLAGLIDQLHAGYAAAIELIADPANLADEYDLYGDEYDEDEDDEDRPIWGPEIYELWEEFCMTFDMRTVELEAALKSRSPQFAELARILKKPTPDEHKRFVAAAEDFNPGFGGELGMFDDWAGPESHGETSPGHIALYASYDINGVLWAEVSRHSLVSISGEVTTKQRFVDNLGLRFYADLDAKWGLRSELHERPIIESGVENHELAANMANQIQYLVERFDEIPVDDVEARRSFSWNDSETDEMLEFLGEEPTRSSRPRYQ